MGDRSQEEERPRRPAEARDCLSDSAHCSARAVSKLDLLASRLRDLMADIDATAVGSLTGADARLYGAANEVHRLARRACEAGCRLGARRPLGSVGRRGGARGPCRPR